MIPVNSKTLSDVNRLNRRKFSRDAVPANVQVIFNKIAELEEELSRAGVNSPTALSIRREMEKLDRQLASMGYEYQ
jgi:hypothetical protein